MLIISHLFSICPQSLAYKRKERHMELEEIHDLQRQMYFMMEIIKSASFDLNAKHIFCLVENK